MRIASLIGAALLLMLAGASVAQASNFYVQPPPVGDDARTCTTAQTISTPVATINKGLTCVGRSGGHTVFIRAGTYNETLANPDISGTNWTTGKTRIAAYPPEMVRIRPSAGDDVVYLGGSQAYLEFDGLILDGTLVQRDTVKIEAYTIAPFNLNPHHIRVQNSEIIGGAAGLFNCVLMVGGGATAASTGGNEFIRNQIHGCGSGTDPTLPDEGIYIESSNTLIDGNTIYDSPGCGMQIYNGYGQPVDNVTIKNNTIRDMRPRNGSGDDRHCAILAYTNGANLLIFNNLIYGLPGFSSGFSIGIYVGVSGSGLGVYHNTVVDNSGEGIAMDAGTSGTLQNNIAYLNAAGNVRNDGGWTSTTNLIGVNPGFTNRTAHDYSLASGGAAIDAGTPLALVTTDIRGTTRPQGPAPDVGAYEFTTASSPPPPPPPPPIPVCPSGQFLTEYFANTTLTGPATVVGCESLIAHTWGAGGPPGLGVDGFSVRWTGPFSFTGTVTFTARSDDGIRAWVDADQVINNWTDHAATTDTATRTLSGTHVVKVEYYENGGDATAIFGWAAVSSTPCVADPLTFTVSRWPTASTGSRSLVYASNKPVKYTVDVIAATFTVTAIDARGCVVTRTKP